MTQVLVDLSDKVTNQIEESGVSQEQLQLIMGRLVELYFSCYPQGINGTQAAFLKDLPRCPRKAGSGKHLNIVMADDFDDPLDDFAEYMW
ncbi:MAG: hypothetical protein ACOYNY_02115 [Caldilineaceae bacterium]